MTAAAAQVVVTRTRRRLDGAASFLLFVALVTLAVVVLASLRGYRPLIVRSDSMLPAVAAGDLVVAEVVRPTQMSVGDVATFPDPSRGGRLVTHRVVSKRTTGTDVAFVTRGDANSGVERWSVRAHGDVGRLVLSVPKVGYAVAFLTLPAVRVLCVVGAALVLGALAVWRIWTA